MNSHQVVSIFAAIALCIHAILGIINGELLLKGGSNISYANEPLSYLGIIAIEIAVSIYVVWAFLIKKDSEEIKKDD